MKFTIGTKVQWVDGGQIRTGEVTGIAYPPRRHILKVRPLRWRSIRVELIAVDKLQRMQ